MDINTLVPEIPLWGVLIGTFLLVILSIFLGYRIGSYHRKHSDNKDDAPVGSRVRYDSARHALQTYSVLKLYPLPRLGGIGRHR